MHKEAPQQKTSDCRELFRVNARCARCSRRRRWRLGCAALAARETERGAGSVVTAHPWDPPRKMAARRACGGGGRRENRKERERGRGGWTSRAIETCG
ncbi:unnamed protein product [Lampetra fluviatilis]